MTWDSQNRMVSCTKGGVTSTYTYGADGLRRQSTVNSVTTDFAYDGHAMIREMKKQAFYLIPLCDRAAPLVCLSYSGRKWPC